MGDMREDFEALKEHGKEHRKSQRKFIEDYLHNFSLENNVQLLNLNEENGHYRLNFGSKKVDVWASTVKCTSVGSGVHLKGFKNLRTLLNNCLGHLTSNQ